MSAGCFSWCPLLKKQTTRTKLDNPKSQLAIVTKESLLTALKSDEKSAEDACLEVPSTSQYITATGKEFLTLLQSAAGIIPVPLLQDVIGVALKIISLCEEASAVDKKIKELQNRVGHVMIVIIDYVTTKEGSNEALAAVKAAKGIEQDIIGLLSTLNAINGNLIEMSKQSRWFTTFYTEPNMSTLDNCMNQLTTALEKFKLSNDLRDSNLLQELQSRLNKMDKKVDNISEDMKHVVTRVDEFHEILSHLERPPTDTIARQQIPLKPEIFYGRDSLVEEIVQWFMKEETSRVCILGPGGMGKTSVSLAVAESSLVQERFPRKNLVWVPCIGATSAALLLEILYVQLQVPGDKQVTLEKIISELNASKDPRLIILDNFETPLNGSTQKDVEYILRRLAQLNYIAIFVSMRGKHPPCNNAIKWQSKNIQPTDQKACLRIFHDINPSSKADPDVGRLLSSLGHMPFAVTLMAKLGKESESTAKELLDTWSKCGPDILSDNPEQSMNRSISLSVESDLVKHNPNAYLLLAVLSLLPAGTTKENLHWWAPKLVIPSAVAALSKAALLVENKRQGSDSPVLFVVPVVQSFMQHHDRISDELRNQIHLSCYQYILDHSCRYNDSTFPIRSRALAAEDTNIQSILFGSHTMQDSQSCDTTMKALIAFSWHRCDTKPDIELANHTVTVAKASGINKYVASALWCLGRTYYQVSKYPLSYDHLQNAYQLFNTLPSADLDLQRLGAQCGIDLADAARMTSRPLREVARLAREIEIKCGTSSDDLIHGQSLMVLGSILNDAGQEQDALCYLDRARTMLETVGNISSLAETHQLIARVHYKERRLPEALMAVTEAWKQAEKSDTPNIQAEIAQEFGKILHSANRDTEAQKYIEISLMKALHVGNPYMVVQALGYMGYGYLRRGDYQNAYDAYEIAVEKADNAYIVENCKANMDAIQYKRSNPNAVVGFYRNWGDVDISSVFYPP